MFTHFTGKSKSFDFSRQLDLPYDAQLCKIRHLDLEPTTHQELRLRLIPKQVETAINSSSGNGREIDPARNILNAGED